MKFNEDFVKSAVKSTDLTGFKNVNLYMSSQDTLPAKVQVRKLIYENYGRTMGVNGNRFLF